MPTNRSLLAIPLAAAALSAVPAGAQNLLLPPEPARGVWLETTYTDFKALDASFPSTVTYLAARTPLTPQLSARVDLPFSYARVDLLEAEETSSVVGNPFVGVEYAASGALSLELGGRLPLTTADEESFADVLAFMSDPQRAEAFLEDVVPVSLAATYTHPLTESLGLRAHGGATELFYTGDDEGGESETTVDYGLSSTYTSGAARFSLGFTGRWLATADAGSFGDNSFHHAGVAADVLVAGVRPGLSVRLPLDSDLREAVGTSFGLYLQVPLR